MDFLRVNPWEKWAAACWGLATVVLCTHAALAPYTHTVYPIFANAARTWEAGGELYGEFVGVRDVYHYSPCVTVLLVPWSRLPDDLAGALWRLLNAGALVAAVLWWARAVLPLARPQRSLLLLLLLPLAIPCLFNGQCNPLMTALVLAAVAGAARGRWNLCSVCVALACMLKVYPLAVGLLLAVLYPRQLAGRLAVALAVCLALPFLAQSPDYVVAQYLHWVRWLSMHDRHQLPLDLCPRDTWLLFQVWVGPLPGGVYHVLQALAGLGCAALCLAVRGQDWSARDRLTLLTGLGCCWMILFGPGTESNTYILLGPSLIASLLRAGEAPSWRVPAALRTSYALLVGAYLVQWFPWGKLVTTFGPQPLAALLLLACLVSATLCRLRRPAQPRHQQPPGRASVPELLTP